MTHDRQHHRIVIIPRPLTCCLQVIPVRPIGETECGDVISAELVQNSFAGFITKFGTKMLALHDEQGLMRDVGLMKGGSQA